MKTDSQRLEEVREKLRQLNPTLGQTMQLLAGSMLRRASNTLPGDPDRQGYIKAVEDFVEELSKI